jgi:hypothetical protein
MCVALQGVRRGWLWGAGMAERGGLRRCGRRGAHLRRVWGRGGARGREAQQPADRVHGPRRELGESRPCEHHPNMCPGPPSVHPLETKTSTYAVASWPRRPTLSLCFDSSRLTTSKQLNASNPHTIRPTVLKTTRHTSPLPNTILPLCLAGPTFDSQVCCRPRNLPRPSLVPAQTPAPAASAAYDSHKPKTAPNTVLQSSNPAPHARTMYPM